MTPQISEQLMNNGSRELALKLAAVSTPEGMADRIVKLEAGFATIMQAYDDPPGGDLRHTVAAAIWALFPPRNTTQP